MNDTTTPRRPMVPGPSANPQSVANRAIAARQQGGALGPLQEKPKNDVVMADPMFPAGRQAEPPKVGKLTKAIASVMKEVGTIEKRGVNKFHGYNYARIEDVLHALTPLMGKHGITIFQNEASINPIENRIAVTYEFTICHESSETMTIRHTSMSIARDSKGQYDDKCLNKCHTAARKYVLLSLFQVPSGDFDDNDAESNTGATKQSVPGPTTKAAEATQETVAEKQLPSSPQKIGLGKGAGVKQWASAYLKAIEQSKTEDEIRQWDTFNDMVLQNINDKYPEIYQQIDAGVQRRLQQLGAPAQQPTETLSGGMPDPKADAQEAMNWIAQQLLDAKTYEGAEAFWNTVVAPRQSDFDESDWSMLMREWERTETRFKPADDEGADGNAPQ